MRIIFLGTNGWYDTDTGNTICILLEANDYYIILDAGNGLYKADKYIKDDKPVYIFLSHFHFDHICGLHILNKFRLKNGLKIFGPEGTKNILNTIINQPFTMPIEQLPYEVKLFELPEDSGVLPFHIETKPLMHSSLTLGYRFEVDRKVIAYCPDTGYCNEAVELSKDADVLITECSYKSRQDVKNWPHLNPEKAATLAKKANAGKLYLTHFDSSIYKNLSDRKNAEIAAKKIFHNTVASTDNLSINL